ncbi:MAG TPA: ABC transporter permease [Gaiellaceae bacterium]|nr:ABC transporter permease [Gaiellaceae bacterium]
MAANSPDIAIPLPARPTSPLGPVATLVRRRFQLSARTPRELVVPLLTPILFALVIAPALKTALHTSAAYESFVATGTIGLLIPLNTMFAGIGVLVDRESGAQRELLAAPIPRGLLVLANLLVAFAITALQVTVLLVVARARGIHFDITASGFLWFAAGGALFTIAMYGLAETLAARVPSTEEYVGRVPAIAIVPWFLAGSLFPIGALPTFLTWFARFLPLTHALALVRYGLLHDPSSLHGIWRFHSTTASAALSLTVVAVFSLLATRVGVRAFTKRAVG